MVPTAAQLELVAGFDTSDSNVNSIVVSLRDYGSYYGLDLPHRLAHFLAQVAHESGGFKFDREIWGPTPAQERYDTRVDLGNTPERDGDGKKNAGKGPIQVTGGYNIGRFEAWCRKIVGKSTPDFTANPDLINTDPWEGLSAIWYWAEGNPTGRSLNVLADENNIEQITKRVNGGLNGYPDRLVKYTRSGLVLLGRSPTDIEGFQRDAKAAGVYVGKIDSDPGPKTRAAIHMSLVALAPSSLTTQVTAGPVVEVKEKTVEVPVEKPIAVVPKGADKPGIGRWMSSIPLLGAPLVAFGGFDRVTQGIILGAVFVGVAALLWRGEQIALRARQVLKSFED